MVDFYRSAAFNPHFTVYNARIKPSRSHRSKFDPPDPLLSFRPQRKVANRHLSPQTQMERQSDVWNEFPKLSIMNALWGVESAIQKSIGVAHELISRAQTGCAKFQRMQEQDRRPDTTEVKLSKEGWDFLVHFHYEFKEDHRPLARYIDWSLVNQLSDQCLWRYLGVDIRAGMFDVARRDQSAAR